MNNIKLQLEIRNGTGNKTDPLLIDLVNALLINYNISDYIFRQALIDGKNYDKSVIVLETDKRIR